VFHPQLKLKYFQQRSWAQDWISTAEAIVREEFAKYDTPSPPTPILVCSLLSIVLYTTCLLPHDDRQRHLLTTWTFQRTFWTSQWMV
jgi:hypothetical protein